ncbi:hypothetical protein K1719_045852 [Acacia pycnantha]|nr:hypothetical protein K1719_045852 [Acacia pycnantha]
MSIGGIWLADTHEMLNDELNWLLALQRDKDNEVSGHITQKDPYEVYKLWKERVSNIEKEVAYLYKKYDETVRHKLQFFRRRHIAKEIKRALSNVIKLLQECPREILVDKLPERVIKEIGVPSIEKYQTFQKAFQDFQALLQSDGVKCVSLHGQKGVGKTTIMQHLNNHFLDRTDFDMVIFIKVASDEQTEDLHILKKIAKRINMDGEANELEVSGRIQCAQGQKIFADFRWCKEDN